MDNSDPAGDVTTTITAADLSERAYRLNGEEVSKEEFFAVRALRAELATRDNELGLQISGIETGLAIFRDKDALAKWVLENGAMPAILNTELCDAAKAWILARLALDE